jgi:hypothetical protein
MDHTDHIDLCSSAFIRVQIPHYRRQLGEVFADGMRLRLRAAAIDRSGVQDGRHAQRQRAVHVVALSIAHVGDLG